MKILLAVDDSKYSDAAVGAVIDQLPPKGAQIRVLHVLQPASMSPPPQMSSMYTPELEAQGKEARGLVDRVADRLRAAGFRVDSALEKGDVRLTIIDSAGEWNADLIVLGSQGRSGLPRLLLGSVAEFVARHARCSVEIVRNRS
jgi:nucleotide-binding universal stress UspA family protein